MIKWDLIQLKCGDCGNDLVIKEGQWGCFYSCSTYPKCFNRMNVDLYEKVLDKITELMTNYPETNFTGYKWEFKTSYQHYKFKIEKHKPDRFVVSVLNVKKTKTPY
jgi:ssDNA-binding Zn-finger/Zn-ribbon topoisomerase 1